MSSTITSVSSTGNAVSAAVMQAQATQYANDFNTLQSTIGSGDLAGAQKAMTAFLKDSAMAKTNGFDPVTQNATVSQDFTSV